MIHTDGNPTIANGAGDRELVNAVEALDPTVGPQSPQEAEIEQAWDYGAERALIVFADSLQDILDVGGTLTLEDVIASAREIAAKVKSGALSD